MESFDEVFDEEMKKISFENLNRIKVGGKRIVVAIKTMVAIMTFLTVPLILWADSGKDLSVDQVSKNVEDAQAGIQDVQMDLKMEMKDSLSGTQQKVEGKVKIKSPDMVYVHYTQPTEQF